MEVPFSWWSCPNASYSARSPTSPPITTGPWSLLPGMAGPTRAREWGTPPPLGHGCYRPRQRVPAAFKQKLRFLPLSRKKKVGRESTWLVCVKETAIRGGLWAASQPLCAGMHLVQCHGVALTTAVNGSHSACGLCSPSPSMLRWQRR